MVIQQQSLKVGFMRSYLSTALIIIFLGTSCSNKIKSAQSAVPFPNPVSLNSTTVVSGIKYQVFYEGKTGNKVPYQVQVLAFNAINVLAKVINSPAFENEVKNSAFDWSNIPTNCPNREKLTGTQVYEALIFSLNKFNSANKILQLQIVKRPWPWRYFTKNVIGYENNDTNTVHTYSNYIDTWAAQDKINGPANYAGHIMHEFCHLEGFCHPKSGFSEQEVPYKVGYIVTQIATNEKLDTSEFNPIIIYPLIV